MVAKGLKVCKVESFKVAFKNKSEAPAVSGEQRSVTFPEHSNKHFLDSDFASEFGIPCLPDCLLQLIWQTD